MLVSLSNHSQPLFMFNWLVLLQNEKLPPLEDATVLACECLATFENDVHEA